jgi:hypothetical protein
MLAEGVIGTQERTIVLEPNCNLKRAIVLGIAQAKLDTEESHGKIKTTVLLNYKGHTIPLLPSDKEEPTFARWNHIFKE